MSRKIRAELEPSRERPWGKNPRNVPGVETRHRESYLGWDLLFQAGEASYFDQQQRNGFATGACDCSFHCTWR